MKDKLTEFEKNIVLWYPFKGNTSVLNLGNDIKKDLEQLDINFSKIDYVDNMKSIELDDANKYDYITIIEDYSYNFEEKLEYAKNHLTDDGKILIATDNKLGLRNWNLSNLSVGTTENSLKDIFNEKQLSNYKFYYVFPNYKMANLIYSEDYELNNEDITRNLCFYEGNRCVALNENELYKALLKDDKKIVNKFANSFFVEISKKEIDTDIKYVTFSNYRKSAYRMMTIITENKVFKKKAHKDAQLHIEKIAENIKRLKAKNLNVIETYENNEIVSDYIRDVRFDVAFESLKNIEECLNYIEIFKNIFEKDIVSYDEIKSELKNDKIYNSYSEEKLKKLHFLREGFVDLIPKNCFYINENLHVFDQEWVMENIPLEFIYYRLILNTHECLSRFGKEELLGRLEIIDYIDLFESLEEKLRNQIIDSGLHEIFFKQYDSIPTLEYELGIYKKQTKIFNEKIKELKEENRILNLTLEDARQKLLSYAAEIRAMAATGAWKTRQKVLEWKIIASGKDKQMLINKLYPLGTAKRAEYDKKQKEKQEEIRLEKMRQATDAETFKYWIELEKRYKERRRKLEEAKEGEATIYELWAKSNDPTEEELEIQRITAENFSIKPKISVLVPLYNTPIDMFRELLYSLYAQTYTNWELCLADGSPERLAKIEEICKDERIKFHFIGENKGISGNTNEALKLATGDYIALLDHDDLLPLNSLYEIVKCINENPDVEFIYTDEDKLESVDEPRYDPHFKPDYSPDYLRSGNYICHFSIFKKELMNKIEGFRSEYDGAQDFDIILRATEDTDPSRIKHVAKILYHWRIHPGSTAGDPEAKLYAYISGQKAVQHHLDRKGIKGVSTRNEKYRGYYDVEYEVTGNPKVHIVIKNRNDVENLKPCIQSILEKTTYKNYEIDILDWDSSNPELLEYYKELEGNSKVVIHRKNDHKEITTFEDMIQTIMMNFDGQFIVDLDKYERILTSNWLERMIGIAQRPEVGCVGARIYNLDKTIKHAGMACGINQFAEYLYQNQFDGDRIKDKIKLNLSCVSSLCRMYRKEIFEEVNGNKPTFVFESLNEIDFSLKVREKGYLIVYNPQVEIQDVDGKRDEINELDVFEYEKQRENLEDRWGNALLKDPYYNVNFSPVSPNCTIRIDKVQ